VENKPAAVWIGEAHLAGVPQHQAGASTLERPRACAFRPVQTGIDLAVSGECEAGIGGGYGATGHEEDVWYLARRR
jgi:hypothetical protein